MKRILSILIIIILTFTPVISSAQTSIPDAPNPVAGEVDPGVAISPMKKGQVAPFTGVLLSPKAVASISTELTNIQKTVDIEVKRAVSEEAAKKNFEIESVRIKSDADKRVLEAKLASKLEEIKVLSDRLKKVEGSDQNLILWVGGSFLAGVVLTVLTVFAVSQSTK